VLGPGGAGPSDDGEIVLEVLSRAPEGRGRNVERELEGWSAAAADGPCSLSELDSLKVIFEDRGKAEHLTLDSTPDVSFNLNLTPDQRKSRAQVPLPYAHKNASQPSGTGTILYDPDSADDIDDDDPDEDLDI